MDEPVFLTVDEVLKLHRASIDRYGGSHGVRDMGLLLSALAMPMATFGGQFLHPDLATMGAALMFHLVQNHPFVDGNKRIGAAASRVFIMMNNAKFDPSSKEFEQVVLDVASGQIGKDAAIEFFQKHVQT
jgi:death-on-curing protein